jgi:undecaprenyl-diphosphatase
MLFGAAAAATVLFVAVAEDVVEGEADAIDQRYSLLVHQLASPTLDTIMRALSAAGSILGVFIAIALTSAYAIYRNHARLAVVLLADGVVAESLNVGLKYAFARPRPGLVWVTAAPSTYSFPSGHSMVSLAVYGAIAAILAHLLPGLRWFVIPAIVLLIGAIGFSRVYLGVHWPFDVIAGFSAGAIPLVVTLHVLHRAERVH